ncbi:MAG TPA: hypothetical protein VH442_08815 [Micromonosporaceae bacterium]
MPARSTPPAAAAETSDVRSRVLAIQFWTGVALAPLAALLLAFGNTTVAAALALVAVVVVALAAILRRQTEPNGVVLGQALRDEIDALRDDVRADITTAARATHRALSEKVDGLHDSVEAMHRQLDNARSVAIEARDVAVEARDAAMRQRPQFPVPPPRRPVAASASVAGVVRHTETVVTRSTVVDEPGYAPSPVTVYGTVTGRGRARVPASDDEVDDRHADFNGRYDARDRDAAPQADVRAGHDRQALTSGRHDDSAVDLGWSLGSWSAMKNGDRWAEVRSDDRGRELRMAERREERRVDETGSHLRIVDRWASVRDDRADGYDRAERDRYDANREADIGGGIQLAGTSDHGNASKAVSDGETRAERRRRLELEAAEPRRDESFEVPRPRRPADDVDPGWSAVDRGWRDVRSGVVEPDDVGRRFPDAPRSPRGWEEAGEDWALSQLRDIQGRESRSDDLRDHRAEHREQLGGYRDRRDGGDYRDGRDGYRDQRDDHRAWDDFGGPNDHKRDDDRDDDRWVRDAGRRGTQVRHSLDFDDTDDRWR